MILPQKMTPALEELSQLKQWVCWKLISAKKIPFTPFGKSVSSHEDASEQWSDYESCCREAEHPKYKNQHHGLDGIGFVFSGDDPYVGIDLDNCRDPGTGKINEFATEVIKTMDTYTEISQSGKGVHMIAIGHHMEKGHNSPKIEMYSHRRYFIFTGNHLGGTPDTINERTLQSEGLEHQHFGAHLSRKVGAETEYDFKIHANAKLPQDRFDAIMANSALFRSTWEHNRKDLGDDVSPSQYDMSLAIQAVRLKWPPDQVAACIIAHRRNYYAGDAFEKALRPDYIKTTYERAIEFVSRGVDIDVAGIQNAINEGGEEGVAELGRKLGIPITEVIKRSMSPSIYYLVYMKQEVRLGTTRDMLNQDAMRAAICEATHKVLEPKKKKEWGYLIELLCTVSRFEEVEGAGQIEEIIDLVDEYYERKGVDDDIKTAIPSGLPFTLDKKVHIHAQSFRRFLNFKVDIKIKPGELLMRLKEAGFRATKINCSGTSKRYWCKTLKKHS